MIDLDKARERFFRHLEEQRSGLDILSELSKEPLDFSFKRAEKFAERARAVESTWDLYRGARALRAWEFLALFHELDPAVLGLNRRGRAAYVEKMGYTAHRSGQALWQFRTHLYALRRSLVEQMPERMRPEDDPIQTVVDLAWFRKWVEEHRVTPHPQVKPTPSDDTLTITAPTDALRIVARVYEQIYTPVERGGTFNPNEPCEIPVVRQALRDAGLSDNLARRAATLMAHRGQGRGRRRNKTK